MDGRGDLVLGLRLVLGGDLGVDVVLLDGQLRLRGVALLEQLALPVGQRLGRGGALGVGLLVALDEALGRGVGDDARQQRDGADRVVVARDRVLDLVRVAVGVEDADDRDAELARLVDGEVLLLGVHDPHRRRRLGQVPDATEALLQLVALATLDEELLLGEAARRVVEVDEVELLEAVEALVHGLEVGQQTAQPALVDVGLADALRLLGDGLLRLLLGADEEDGAAVGDRLLDEVVRLVDEGQRLLQVDDVDAGALGEDEALHLRVPARLWVTEVDAAVEQLADGDDGHGRTPVPARAVAARLVGSLGGRDDR